jgi:hypothetical protein
MAVNKAAPSRISWELAGTAAHKQTAKQKRPIIRLIFTSNCFSESQDR